jgi:hypothetical protein
MSERKHEQERLPSGRCRYGIEFGCEPIGGVIHNGLGPHSLTEDRCAGSGHIKPPKGSVLASDEGKGRQDNDNVQVSSVCSVCRCGI